MRLDLLILNPAFAFVEGSVNSVEPVGDFLRNHLQTFLREKNAAGLPPRPQAPKIGKKGSRRRYHHVQWPRERRVRQRPPCQPNDRAYAGVVVAVLQ